MKVVTLKNIPDLPVEGADRIEGWTGPVSRSRQTIIEPGDSGNYNASVVNFSQGCTTGWHTHTCDQILVVTSGSGMVAVEGGTPQEINVGDVVHIKSGERHWHGAKATRRWATSPSPPSAARRSGGNPLLCHSGALPSSEPENPRTPPAPILERSVFMGSRLRGNDK